jgi:hypothetical protein
MRRPRHRSSSDDVGGGGGAKGESAHRLVSIGAARTTKASSEGWRLRLRPNKWLMPFVFRSIISLRI